MAPGNHYGPHYTCLQNTYKDSSFALKVSMFRKPLPVGPSCLMPKSEHTPSQVGLGKNLPEYSHTFLGRVTATLPWGVDRRGNCQGVVRLTSGVRFGSYNLAKWYSFNSWVSNVLFSSVPDRKTYSFRSLTCHHSTQMSKVWRCGKRKTSGQQSTGPFCLLHPLLWKELVGIPDDVYGALQ